MAASKHSICDIKNNTKKFRLCSMFKQAPMEKASFMAEWNITPMEKALWPKWSISWWFIAPMEKAWFYERLFLELVTVIVKDKKMQYKRYTISIKINHDYTKWTRVMLPVVFQEFQMVHIFLLLFSFYYHCQLVKGQVKQKSEELQPIINLLQYVF